MIWRPDPASPGRAAGFTLIEILVALAIVAFSSVLVASYRPPWSSGLEIDATAARLAAGLRLVRSEAIAANRSVAFEFDLAGRRYRSGSAPPQSLPDRMAGGLLAITRGQQRSGPGRVPLFPSRKLARG